MTEEDWARQVSATIEYQKKQTPVAGFTITINSSSAAHMERLARHGGIGQAQINIQISRQVLIIAVANSSLTYPREKMAGWLEDWATRIAAAMTNALRTAAAQNLRVSLTSTVQWFTY